VFNLAVIGCGYWGPNLIRNFRSLQEVKLKIVCDKDQNRLDHMKTLYPDIETTTNYEDILKDNSIHAVGIATPVFTHHKLAKACLIAGKHTFVEKPLASSSDECKDLIKIAKDKSLILMVGHFFIYTPPVIAIKEYIKSGELGDVFYISTRRLNLGPFQKDINVAWDLATHDIAIILYLLEENPVSVNCQGKAHINPNIEDITTISLNFNSTRYATIQSSWIDPHKIRDVTIVGSKKMIVYDDTQPLEKIKVFDKRVMAPPHYDTFAEFQYSYHYGDIHIPYLKQVEPLKTECQDFIDCIKTGKKSLASGENGLEVVKILEAANKSLKENGCPIQLK